MTGDNAPVEAVSRREAEAPQLSSRSAVFQALGVGLAAMVMLALRAPFAWSRLWAEDGTVFLQQPIDHGIARSFWHAYAGYYLFVPRVIGAVASALPIRAAAFTTWLGVALVIGWCAATIYHESDGLLTSYPTRVLLALSVVLLPALGLEAIANAADLQYTLLFTALVALTGMSKSRWSSVNRVAIVAVTGLTTPLSLILAPVAVLRILRARPRRVDATFVAWGAATAVQLGMILIARPPRNVGTPSKASRLIGRYEHRVLYGNLLPKRFSTSTATIAPLVAILCLVLVILAAVLAWRRVRRARSVLLLLVPAIGFVFWWFAGTRYGLPARYRVFPALCVVWAVLVAWEEIARAGKPRQRVDWRFASVIVVLLALSWTTYWRPLSYRSSGPAWSNRLSLVHRLCQKSHAPAFALRISPVSADSAVWTVRLSCDEIG